MSTIMSRGVCVCVRGKTQFEFVDLTPSPPLDRRHVAEQHKSPLWLLSLISFIYQQHNCVIKMRLATFPASSRPSQTVNRVCGLCPLLSDRKWMFMMSLSATPSLRAVSLPPLAQIKASVLGQFKKKKKGAGRRAWRKQRWDEKELAWDWNRRINQTVGFICYLDLDKCITNCPL